MKKLSVLIATVAFLFSATTQAQISKKSENTRTSSKQTSTSSNTASTDVDSPLIYGTMVVYEQNSQEIVKISFDEIIQRIGPDKAKMKLTIDIANHRFESMGEALNVLSSHGWNVDQTWITEGTRTGTELNFLLSKSVGKLSPVFPWVEKRDIDAGAKEKSKKK